MQDTLKLLLIEDNPLDARLIKEYLIEARIRFDLDVAPTLSEGINSLSSGIASYDAVLLDLFLPDSMGYSTFESIHAEANNLPILVLTGLDDDELGAKTIRAGAQDYIPKSMVEPHSLTKSIRFAIERKQAEINIKKAKEIWETTFDAVPDGVMVLDLDYNILQMNTKMAGLLNCKPDDAIGKKCYQYVHRLEAPPDYCPHRHLIVDGEAHKTELRNFLQASNMIIHDSPIRDNAGIMIGSVHVTHDISESREAEELIRKNEELLRQILNQIPIPMALGNINGTLEFVNQRFIKTFGYDLTDIPTLRQWHQLAYPNPEQRSIVKKIWHNDISHSINTGAELPPREYNITCKNGEVRTVEIYGVPIDSKFIVLLNDISIRKITEQIEQRNTEKMQFLLETNELVAHFTDRELFNHLIEGAVRLTDSKIGFFHLVVDDQKSIVLTAWSKEAIDNYEAFYDYRYPIEQAGNWVDCLREKNPIVYNDYANSPNRKGLPPGHAPIVRFMSIPIIENGKVIMVLGVGNKESDYSQQDLIQFQLMANELHKVMMRRKVEKELRQHKDHLEELVLERTENLIESKKQLEAEINERIEVEKKLVLAKELAEKANRAKSTFLANMSHEIRTPMNAILGFTQILMRDSTLSDEQKRQINTVNSSGEHLLALINDILEMSKIESGSSKVSLSTINLHEFLKDLISMFKARAESSGLYLILDIVEKLPLKIISDENKLRQILINLLSNAIKFTNQGGVSLRAWNEDLENGHIVVYIEVADTGQGIAAEDLPLVFDAFEQVASEKNRHEGTGLGLAISRSFARMLGGDITVSSILSKGSSFNLSLEAQEDISPESIRSQMMPGVNQLAPGQPACKILIVDDIANNLYLLSSMLAKVGFITSEARNGKEAVELYKSWKPHLILMDMRMPVMDGYQAIKLIRDDKSGNWIPIIAVTASAFDEDKERILKSGADDYIRKPFKYKDVLDKIKNLLHVKYIYENSLKPGQPVNDFSDTHLGKLKPDILTAIRSAAEQADFFGLLKLLEKINKDFPRTAQNLSKLLEAYDYERILMLLPKEGSFDAN